MRRINSECLFNFLEAGGGWSGRRRVVVVLVVVGVGVGSWNERCKQRIWPESYKRRRADNLIRIELMRSDDGDVQMRILGDWKT